MKIELRDIHKHYGMVRANDGVTFAADSGTIHGILGENGAGKSTLMKVLAGFISKTSGTIRIDGAPAAYDTPTRAAAYGIGMLYQDPLDFPSLTILDNFMLGQSRGLKNPSMSFRKTLHRLTREFGFTLNPDDPVKTLTVGERQQLEILRLITLGIRVLILDEPTTGISDVQKETLFNALRKLVSEGKTVILVSHKLEDVETLCHRVTVLRQGKVTGDAIQPFDTQTLLGMMFGSPPPPPCHKHREGGDIVLTMEKISATGGRTGLMECSVKLRAGEVVGLAGLEGSGQGIFLRVAAGLKRPLGGRMELLGRPVTSYDYHQAQPKGITFLPTDRIEEGLISSLSISEHFGLKDKRKKFFIDHESAAVSAREKIDQFKIKGFPESAVESLSGGNQQRLLLSFLPAEARLLLLENPTRGLDMESANWVWQHLYTYSGKGVCIVFSSSEIDEIMLVADRVLVFFEGTLVLDVETCDTNLNELGRAIAGKYDPRKRGVGKP
jgi:general nucleoside transport system ATP-binding protein